MGTAVLDQAVEEHAVKEHAVDLAALEAAAEGFCGGFDADRLTASQAADVLARVTVLERRMAAVKGRAARRVEISSVWQHAGHRSMADWLAARTGDPVGVSVGVLDMAKKLETLPATADALASGDVSLAAAREIAGAVAADPTAEAGLLAVATSGSGHRELVDSAARVRRAAASAEDEAARHERLRARRFARTHTDADGMVLLHAGFAPKDWAQITATFERGTDAQFRAARRQGRREPVEAYAADALLAMLTHTGAAIDATDATDAVAASKPIRSAKPEVIVLVDGIALKRGHLSVGERCEIVGVGPVEVDWVNKLLPEAIVHALVHDGVDITTYASATRSIRKAVRLAVKTRDCWCVVPGCHRARRTQHDHRRDFSKGGPGSTDNLNLLCEFHHNQKSRVGARLERVDDHWHWYPPGHTAPWTGPVGATLTLWDTDTT